MSEIPEKQIKRLREPLLSTLRTKILYLYQNLFSEYNVEGKTDVEIGDVWLFSENDGEYKIITTSKGEYKTKGLIIAGGRKIKRRDSRFNLLVRYYWH